MENASFNEYLEKRYFSQLDYFRKSAAKNQGRYYKFQWILIILSTLTTILAALPEGFHLQYFVVGTAGIVTILTAGLKTFQYQELSINYRSTAEELKPQIYYYKLNIGEYATVKDKEAYFVQTIENILNKERSNWQTIRNQQEQKPKESINELQNKLDELIRSHLNTQKPTPENMEVEPSPTPDDMGAEVTEVVETDPNEAHSVDAEVENNAGEENGDKTGGDIPVKP